MCVRVRIVGTNLPDDRQVFITPSALYRVLLTERYFVFETFSLFLSAVTRPTVYDIAYWFLVRSPSFVDFPSSAADDAFGSPKRAIPFYARARHIIRTGNYRTAGATRSLARYGPRRNDAFVFVPNFSFSRCRRIFGGRQMSAGHGCGRRFEIARFVRVFTWINVANSQQKHHDVCRSCFRNQVHAHAVNVFRGGYYVRDTS